MHDEHGFRSLVEETPVPHRQGVTANLEKFEDDFRDTQVVPSSIVLLDMLSTMPSGRTGLMGGSPRLAVTRVVLRLLRAMESDEDRLEAVTAIVNGTSSLSGQLAVLDLAGHRENAGHGLITREEDERLRGAWRERVRARGERELAAEWDLGRIMLTVRDDQADVEPTLEPLRDPRLAAALLISLSGASVSQTLGSRFVQHHPRISWQLFVDVVGGGEQAERWVKRLREEDLVPHDLAILAERYSNGWRPDEFGDT